MTTHIPDVWHAAEVEQAIGFWRQFMTYNDNIELIRPATKPEPLADNEWYALMVIDDRVADRGGKLDHGDRRKFFKQEMGWLGLERPSSGEPYISKDFQRRLDFTRGETWVVRVTDPQKCCVLAA